MAMCEAIPYAHAVRARLTALLVAALPALAAAQDEDVAYTEHPSAARFHLTAWGGSSLDTTGDNPGAAHFGGEAAYAFEAADVGILAEGYRLGDRARSPWAPVVLARYLQRFETRRGLEATLGFGLGVGRTKSWIGWYQVALGVRLLAGPLFIAGELGFEQLDLLRLAAGVGVRF
jgi:hypothetical protein